MGLFDSDAKKATKEVERQVKIKVAMKSKKVREEIKKRFKIYPFFNFYC
jgi:hypothetical protein